MSGIIMNLSGKQFNEIIKALSAIVSETRIHASPEGLTIQCVDSLNISMIGMRLSKDYFESYQYPTDESKQFTFAIDVCKYSHWINPQETAHVKWSIPTVGSKPVAEIEINGRRTYRVECLELITLRPDPSDPPWALDLSNKGNKVEINADMFYEVLKAPAVIGDEITIRTAESKLAFIGENDNDSITEEVDFKALSNLEDVNSHFSIEYLEEIAKYLKTKGQIELDFYENFPIRIIKHNLGDDINSLVWYAVCPRIRGDA